METKESDWQKKKHLKLERNRGCLTRYVLLTMGPKCRYETTVQKSKNNPLIGHTKGQTESASLELKLARKSRSSQAGSTVECLKTRT